ncbi:hypothetical protein [Nocardia pneumoniae]|uniref:hypothetical protein n=1 Tax=Nocardia pneumoniae TaxID=228601 RepID=UPI0012F6B299|nr:hypothetical protein [Nocardia pneumoniae]
MIDETPLALRYSEWVDNFGLRIDRLKANLPEDVRLDSSSASLGRLEAEVLRRFGEVSQLSAPEAQPFLEGVVAYVGDMLIRVGGGGWSGDNYRDVPLLEMIGIQPNEDYDLEKVEPMDLLRAVVRERDGDLFMWLYHAWEDTVYDHYGIL